ncbi:MAG: hypothetical protein ACI8UO_005869 [Verrucomicrobiales bacterium]|jgi:hypothetical protein
MKSRPGKLRSFGRRTAFILLAAITFMTTAAKDEDEKKGGFFFFGKKDSEKKAEEASKTQGGAWKPVSKSKSKSSRSRSPVRSRVGLGPLPAWSEADLDESDGSPVLGGALWPAEARPTPLGVAAENIIIAAEPLEAGPDPGKPDFENMLVIPPPPLPDPEIDPEIQHEAEARAVAEQLAATPASYLIDPQHLLTEQEGEDIEHFLAYHARETAVSVAMLILPSGLNLPAEVSTAELRRKWFGDEPVILLVYSLGNPGAAEIVWQNAGMPLEAQQAIWSACLSESLVAHDPFNQVQRFLTELEVRLYWYYVEDQPESAPELDLVAWNAESTSPALPVVQKEFNWPILGAGISGFAALIVMISIIRRRRSAQPVLLPEIEVCPRLGAPYGGGGHAVINFGTSSES